ncbi:MAG: hypothetical protein ABIT05_08515 [Chitinophagaceae bacterium]
MEVHTHSHTPRKKWMHYFWEFFMLFLAVTLGFFVENTREHRIEHKREREYILSMIDDLKEDTSNFRFVISKNKKSAVEIDTLITLLKGEQTNALAKRIYYTARLLPISDVELVCQDKTFEQLKGSGSIRLIRKQETQNKIGAYYRIVNFIRTGPSQMQFQNRRDLFLSYNKVFDAATLQEIIKTFQDSSVNIPESHFSLLTKDPVIINEICTRFHLIYSFKKVVSSEAGGFIKDAAALIGYLKKEYHLE